jgi:hypothetical protein
MNEVLKQLMGDSFNENLTAEEITSFFENSVAKSGKYVPLDKYTSVEKKAKTADSLQKELDTYKTAQMTEQEKTQQALEEARTYIKQLEKSNCKKSVEKVLTEGGLTESDYKEIIDSLVLEDEEQSTKLAQNLVKTFNARIDAEVKAKMAEQLAKAGAKKPEGAEGGEITKEQFNKMTYSQQIKLAETNPELYKSLSTN